MGKYWKSPKEEHWFVIIADNEPVGVMIQSPALDRERKRFEGTLSVDVVLADNNDLLRFGAKTLIPKRIITNMAQLSGRQKALF